MKIIICLLLSLCFFTTLKGEEEKNTILLCDNGLEMFSWDLEFLRHAQYALDISACFFGGEIARELLREIEARLEACSTLQVSILVTPVLMETEDFAYVDRLRKRFPTQFHFEYATSVTILWPDVTGIDNHVKVFIVDEEYFSMGGTNLEEAQCTDGTYTPPKNDKKKHSIGNNLPAAMRDQDIVGKGPIAKELRKTFCKLYSLWENFNKTGILETDPAVFEENSYYFEIVDKPFVERFETAEHKIDLETDQMEYILCGPHQNKNAITQKYVELIKGAQREIKIANVYMCPCDEIFQALLDAVNRGVILTVITNGVHEISPDYCKCFCWANRMAYLPFFQGRAYHFWDYPIVKNKKPHATRLFEYHVEDVLLHKKIMIVDGETFVIGSYNLGTKSHLGDYETIMVVRSAEVVKEANKVFTRDLEHSQAVKYEEAVSWYFDPISSYIGEFQKRFHGLI